MPMIKKIVTVGASRGITIPKSWLDYYEKFYGKTISEVEMIIKDYQIIITARVPTCSDTQQSAPTTRKQK